MTTTLPTPGRRILLAEDNTVNQTIAVTLLGKMGHHVDVANDGAEAIRMLAASSYDLVFMDCEMPVLDGFAATAEIRRKEGANGRIPIIAMTAHNRAGDRERCLSAGMDDYLTKPFRKPEIVAALDRWLPTLRP